MVERNRTIAIASEGWGLPRKGHKKTFCIDGNVLYLNWVLDYTVGRHFENKVADIP